MDDIASDILKYADTQAFVLIWDGYKKGKSMKKRRRMIPKKMRIPIFLALAVNMMAYYGSRLLTTNRFHYDLSCSLDGKIPFVPWTIIIYWGCYVFWIVNYIIGCRQNEEKAFRFLSADFLAKLVCLLCFLALPTTNIRPVIEGSSIWEELMKMLYNVDAADNLFPSIHCLTSCFCFIAVRGNDKVPQWYRVVSLLIAVSICISTLTTKQHVLIDVVAGAALSEISWLIVEKTGFSKWYADIISKIELKKTERGRLCE